QYPACTSGCSVSGPSVTYQYTNGFLTSIPSWVTSITYNSNGTVNQVSFPNGGTWTQTVDASTAMQRPSSITAGGWQSGTYQYDGAGNITNIGSDYVLYDTVSRVTEASAYGSGNVSQRYTYDTFGNLKDRTNFVNGGFSQYYPFNPSPTRN